MNTEFTIEDEQELALLEQEFEQAGGDKIIGGTIMGNDLVYAGGNERYERICELRDKRGPARREIELTCRITVRVEGEYMSERELAQILHDPGKLERIVAEALRLRTDRADDLGYTPDGNRTAYIDELLSVDDVLADYRTTSFER